jgi:PST family polysaccharide transporter
MLFSSLAANDFCSRVSSIIVSIVLAWAGCRHWALVAGAVAQPLTQCIGAWMLCRWKPGAPRRSNGTASTIRFAAHVYGRFVVNYFTRNVDNLIVGSQFGSEALGFYKRAYDLFALSTSQLTSPLTNVAVAALSRFSPSSLEYRHFLRRALATLAFVGMGIAMNLALIGNDLIRVLLGLGWETSGRIFSFFAPGIGVMVVYYVHGWIHLSIGRPERWLIWEVVEVTVTCLLFVLALPWGPVGIAAAWTAAFWVLTIPAFWYAGRPIGLGVKVALGTVWRYLVASIVAFWACEALGQAFPFLRGLLGVPWALLRIAMTSVLFGVVYLGAVVVLHRGNGPIRDAAQLLKEMKFLRKNSQPGAGVAAA